MTNTSEQTAKKGVRFHLTIQDYLTQGPHAKSQARRKTEQLDKLFKKFRKQASDLFITSEQEEMFEDFYISCMASADGEISFEEQTLVKFDNYLYEKAQK